jgi:hypothetical protein
MIRLRPPNPARRACCAGLLALAFALPAAAQSGRAPADGDGVQRPTRAQILADESLRKALSRSSAGLEAVRHADGTLTVHLQGRFQSLSAARIGRDGRLEAICTGNHETLADFLAAHPDAAIGGVDDGHE